MKLPALILALCLAAVIAIAGCGSSSGDSSSSSLESSASTDSTNSTDSSSESEKTKPKVTVPKGISPKEFKIRELEEGTGPGVKTGDTVTIHYVLVGYDSKREVDSTWNQKPYTFTLGGGKVLKGGERGIEGMKVGGRRELVIPGNLAYGPGGFPPDIAPNETLIFVVDLLAVK